MQLSLPLLLLPEREIRSLQTSKFDATLIGTSPLMLMAGAKLARGGWKVALLDRGPSVGGSWRFGSVLGFDNVEFGVHILENRPNVYEFIQHEIGIPLRESRKGEDLGLLFGRVPVEFGLSRIALHSLVAVKALLRGKGGQSLRMTKSATRALLYRKCLARYPLGGCSAFVRALCERIESSNGRIFLECDVNEIEIDLSKSEAVCKTTEGEFRSAKLVVSSRAHAPVTIGGEAFPWAAQDARSHSLVLHVRGEKYKPFGYIEFIGDSVVRRVRDIGQFATPRPRQGEILLCVQIRRSHDLRVAADVVLEKLRRSGLLAHGSTLIDFHYDEVRFATVPDRELRLAAKAGAPVLLSLCTTDLGDEIYNIILGGREGEIGLPI